MYRVYGNNLNPWWEWTWNPGIRAVLYTHPTGVHLVTPHEHRVYPDLDTAKVAVELRLK